MYFSIFATFWLRYAKKKFHFSKEKMDFWPFSCFGQNHKNGQKNIFYFEKWNFFWHTLIIWGDENFSFFKLFDSVKKSRQKRKMFTFVHGPFLQFLAQKCQKYPFSWKNPFLHFSRKWVFVPARAIFLRTVKYWLLRMWELCIWCKIK